MHAPVVKAVRAMRVRILQEEEEDTKVVKEERGLMAGHSIMSEMPNYPMFFLAYLLQWRHSVANQIRIFQLSLFLSSLNVVIKIEFLVPCWVRKDHGEKVETRRQDKRFLLLFSWRALELAPDPSATDFSFLFLPHHGERKRKKETSPR